MQSGDEVRHVPVLHTDGGSPVERTVLGVLLPQDGESVLDVTLGLGGHAQAFLRAVGAHGHLTGVDADSENLAIARKRLAPFGDRFTGIHANFREVPRLNLHADILFADLGLSSPHVDDPTRGFSFRASAPLDLRFDRESGTTAAKLLATVGDREIARWLRSYGELRDAGRIGQLLSDAAVAGALRTTDDAKRVIEAAVGYRAPKILPQVFQALRIAVNDELTTLQTLLDAIPSVLNPGGRCGIISYHSLEDRLVKRAFKALGADQKDPQTGAVSIPADYEILTPRPIVPSDAEIAQNPRARSAKFRALRRLR